MVRPLLWRLSMRYIVWAYTHLLPARTADYNPADSDRQYGFNICPEQDRWTLHTLAAAPPDHPVPDYTFWIRAVDDGVFRATEIETGISAMDAPTPNEAIDNYWKGDI